MSFAEAKADVTTDKDWRYREEKYGISIRPNSEAAKTGDVVIPETINGKQVVKIADYAFAGCTNLKTIQIPETVTNIGESGFQACINLIAVNIPNGVINIEYNTFNYCPKLENIEIPPSVKVIGNGAFCGCTSMKSIVFSEGIQIIEESAFAFCESVENIIIPVSLEIIGVDAFLGNKRVKKYEVLEGNKFFMSKEGILYNKNQTEIIVYPPTLQNTIFYIPNSVVKITEGCFYDAVLLKKIIISESVNEIGEGAFYGCTGLEEVNIPGSLKKIEDLLFYECLNLKSISLPDGLMEIGASAFYMTALEDVVIPNSVIDLKVNAFCQCKQLKSVILSNNLQYLGRFSFYGCQSLRSIIIPNHITYIGTATFSGCDLIETVVIPESVETIYEGAFNIENLNKVIILNPNINISDPLMTFCSCKEFVGHSNSTIHSLAINNNWGFVPFDISLDNDAITIQKGEFKSINAMNNTTKILCWSSDNTEVALVNQEGKIEAIKAGKSIISIKVIVGEVEYSSSCTITVPGIILNNNKETINIGENHQIKIDTNTTGTNIVFSSDDENIASVSSSGLIVGKKVGCATIVARSEDGKYKECCKIYVKAVSKTNIKLSSNKLVLGKGETYIIKHKITSSNLKQKIRYKSTDKSIASVSSLGKIHARRAGKVNIIAETSSGKKDECIVVVKKKPIKIVKLNKSLIRLKKGMTFQVVVTLPKNSASNYLKYHSSKKNVATVNASGKVKAIHRGITIISVKTYNGKTKIMKIIVK